MTEARSRGLSSFLGGGAAIRSPNRSRRRLRGDYDRFILRVVAVCAMACLVLSAPVGAQTPPVRLAAAADCQRNPNCAPGLRRVYHADPTGSLVRLKVADAG